MADWLREVGAGWSMGWLSGGGADRAGGSMLVSDRGDRAAGGLAAWLALIGRRSD